MTVWSWKLTSSTRGDEILFLTNDTKIVSQSKQHDAKSKQHDTKSKQHDTSFLIKVNGGKSLFFIKVYKVKNLRKKSIKMFCVVSLTKSILLNLWYCHCFFIYRYAILTKHVVSKDRWSMSPWIQYRKGWKVLLLLSSVLLRWDRTWGSSQLRKTKTTIDQKSLLHRSTAQLIDLILLHHILHHSRI